MFQVHMPCVELGVGLVQDCNRLRFRFFNEYGIEMSWCLSSFRIGDGNWYEGMV